MRYFVIFIAAVAVAALAYPAVQEAFYGSATAQDSRKYAFVNDMALDTAMSDGTPSVSCQNDVLRNAIRVRCSSHSSWQTVATNTQANLTCPRTDSGMHWRDSVSQDDGVYNTVNWDCRLDASGVHPEAVSSKQTVELNGKLSLCVDSYSTTAVSCNYYGADGTEKPRKE